MATVKGLLVEIGGDTSALQKALSQVNKETSALSKELKGINTLLKFDPSNVVLTQQKEAVLNEEIAKTEDKLKALKQAQDKADNSDKIDKNSAEYRNLQREIINTQLKLSDLKNEASDWTKAGKAIQTYGTQLTEIGDKVSKLGGGLTKTITLPLTAIATAGITYNAQLEKYTKAFETFLGDAKEAERVVNNIKNDVAKTPFDTTTLVRANQLLIATGENADNAREVILNLGDAVSATGGGNEELDRMAINLQQIKNAGKATALDIKQFAYAGIDVYGLLADYTGKATEEIKDMEVSYEDLSGALKKASSEGGKYYKAMDKASETLTGQMRKLTVETKEAAGGLVQSLMPAIKDIIGNANQLISKFNGLSDEEKKNIVNIGLMVAAAGPLLSVFGNLISVGGTLTKGIGTLFQAISLAHNGIGTATGSAANLAKAFQAVISPTGLAVTAIAGLTAATVYFATKETEAQKAAREFAEEIASHKSEFDEFNKQIDAATESSLREISAVDKLKGELRELVDENGRVKKGYEGRVSFILSELNNALGTEYKLTDGVIEKYKELQDEIDNLVEKKRAEIILNSQEQKYREAKDQETKAVEDLKNAMDNLNKSQEKYGENVDGLRQKVKKLYDSAIFETSFFRRNDLIQEAKELENVINAYDNAKKMLKEYTDSVKTYQDNYALFIQGKYDEIKYAITESTKDWTDESLDTIKNSISEQSKSLELYKQIYKETGYEVSEEAYKQTQENLNKLADELRARTSSVETLGQDEIDAWKTLGEESKDTYDMAIMDMPADLRRKIEEMTQVPYDESNAMALSFANLAENSKDEFDTIINQMPDDMKDDIIAVANSVKDNEGKVTDETKAMMNKVLKELNKEQEGTTAGENLVTGIQKGIDNGTVQSKIINSASSLAGRILNTFRKVWDEQSPSKATKEDAINLLKGIILGLDGYEDKAVSEAKAVAENILSAMDLSNLISETNSPLNTNLGQLNSEIIDSTRNIFTTPNIIINTNDLNQEKLDLIYADINRRFGTAY